MKENTLFVKLAVFKGLYGKYATVNFETKLKYNLYSYLVYNEQFFFSLKYFMSELTVLSEAPLSAGITLRVNRDHPVTLEGFHGPSPGSCYGSPTSKP